MAAVHRHKFVNRGFVSGPICPVYGAGAAAVAVFLPELKDQLFFLFLGGMIVTTFVGISDRTYSGTDLSQKMVGLL